MWPIDALGVIDRSPRAWPGWRLLLRPGLFTYPVDALDVTGRAPGVRPGWWLLLRLGLFDGRGSECVQCPGIELAGDRQNSLFLKIPDRSASPRPHQAIDRPGIEAELFESFLDVQHLIRLRAGHAGDAGQPEGKKDDEGRTNHVLTAFSAEVARSMGSRDR